MSQKQDYNKSEEAHKLLFSRHDGVLSTISQHEGIEGFPFGSVTPFCLDRQGRLIVLISDLAQHTKNITENPRVSMTIQADVDRSSDVQAHGRLTYLGTAVPVPDDEVDEIKFRYVRYLPSAEQYFEAHSFSYYRINLVKARFIGGFGKIFWVLPEELLLDNPFNEQEEISILQHMNEDHQVAMEKYLLDQCDLEVSAEASLEMVGIDAKGCDIRYTDQIYRIWFETMVENSQQAREQLVQMAN